MDRDKLVKVQFYDSETGYENLWASNIATDRYRIESVPFFVYGIALGDVVIAEPDDEGRLFYVRTARHSGNRTLRARSDHLIGNAELRKTLVTGLRALGCEAELHRNSLVSINVPVKADIEAIKHYLTDNALSWEYGCPEKLNE